MQLVQPITGCFANLQIAVTCFRAVRGDPEGDDLTIARGRYGGSHCGVK